MSTDYLTTARLRHELLVQMPDGAWRSFGRFNAPDLEFGSSSTTVDDPDSPTNAPIPIGGRQTGGDLPLTRPWKRTRDSPVYTLLKPLRGRAQCKVLVHELDAYGQPHSSVPLDTLIGVLATCTKPASEAGGEDSAPFAVSVTVQG